MIAAQSVRDAVRVPLRLAVRLTGAAALALALVQPAAATKIDRIVSPAGIEAWLVREPSVPLVAMSFALRGGASQDPADKAGLANMVASLIDEGAGPYDSRAYHERLEAKAIEIDFNAGRDQIGGSLRTLTENLDEAAELMRIALVAPRFEAGDVERVRAQVLSSLRRESTNPNEIASKRWWETAFPGHAYGRPVRGNADTVAAITPDDLKTFVRKTFARDVVKIAIVGNIDAAAAGALIDKVFGGLPAKATLVAVDTVQPKELGRRVVVDTDVPQSVVVLGGQGIPRKDPDFMAAFIVNHILGGGSFSSRLYREVREVRGLAYSVYSMLVPLKHTALFMSGTATRTERAAETLDVIEKEIKRIAEAGPTEEELAKAKSYLHGSYALNFDTSSKIAGQLVALQVDDMGIDYIDKRKTMIDAVTLADVKRVAKRLLEGGQLVTVVGRSPPVTPAKAQGG